HVPAISVIIPVYNCLATLPACVEALFAQDFTNFEIVLVDDASSDGTSDYCRTLAEHHAQISCLNLPVNGGQGSARNAALTVAQGDYILFVDADDSVTPRMLGLLYQQAQHSAADIVICGYYEISASLTRTILPAASYTPQALLHDRRLLAAPWNKLFRRAFLTEHGISFPPCRSAEDMAFVVKALLCHPRLASCPQALYQYAMHEGNTSHNLARRADAFFALRDVKQFLLQHNIYAPYRASYWTLVFNFALRFPLHLFLVVSLWQGKQRWENIRALPVYLTALVVFLYQNVKD
ncbi:MAG: glycosyltransferase, partial [Desulfovibrionaceae bacterium]